MAHTQTDQRFGPQPYANHESQFPRNMIILSAVGIQHASTTLPHGNPCVYTLNADNTALHRALNSGSMRSLYSCVAVPLTYPAWHNSMDPILKHSPSTDYSQLITSICQD